MQKVRLHINSGFSLVELIVSISVFLIFVIALNGVIGSTTTATKGATNKERAVVLAEEGLEAVRNIRDADFANLVDGTYGLSTAGNIFSLLETSDMTDIFTRVLNISTISGSQKKVTTTISWSDQTSPTNSVILNTYLTNWRAPLNIGLTIDKVVVGGTKVPSDFLPTNLNTNVLDNTVDPPVLQNISIPIIFAPSTMVNLSPEVYTFLTSSDPNYNLSLSSACIGNSITLTDGAVACTITYTANNVNCTGTPWGIMTSGTSNTAYLSGTPVGACTSETRTCTNGILSGSYTATSCISGCTGTLWGNVPTGYSNTAYQSSSVTYPSTCISETRVCTAGTMSGTYTNTSCTVTPITPTVTTISPVTSISQTTAVGGGNTTSNGGATITASGLVWSTSINPTIVLSTKTNDGWAIGGPWTSTMTGLTPNTLYHVRAYVTNSVGTSYGADVTFTTLASNCTGTPWGTMTNGTFNTAYQTSSVNYPSSCISETRTCTNGILSGTYTNTSCVVNPVIPTVTTTSPVTSITRTTATGGGNVTSDGGASVTARGVVWDTNINPTIALSTKTSNGTGTGTFTSSITSLTCNILYHIRAYATNSVGTSYGSDVTFTTSACSAITFVGQATSNTTTVTIPSHNVGDLLVVFAYRSSSNTPPAVPSGWTTINSSGAASNSSVLAYRIATGTDSGSGWTSATQVVVQVYRGVSASPIGANGFGHVNSTTVTYPALTLIVTDGTSWVIGFAGAASNSSTVEVVPSGMTARADIIGASAEAAGFDTNGGVSSWTAKNVVISAGNVKWSARTLEIKSN